MSISPGSIDESERFFPPEERRIAELLESEGKSVVAKKATSKHRSADAEVNGVLTEFKTLDPLRANNASIKNAINDSIRRKGQARHIIIDARGTRLSEAEARRGLARARNITRGKLDTARVIGDGFDLYGADFS